MPAATAHLTFVLARYETLLGSRNYDQLDRELFEGTWAPTPGVLTTDELKSVAPMIVEFEIAVAKRDVDRANQALQQARTWTRQRGG
jgi:hypothetical protein